MVKKSFFKERTAAEIRGMDSKQVHRSRNLVRRILDLDPSEDSLELRVRIIPGGFHRGVESGAEASAKCYKHGDAIGLSHPRTQKEAYASREIPLAVRVRDFDRLRRFRESNINFIGYTFWPVQGNDRRKRVVHFAWLLEATRLFSYSENRTMGIEVHSYDDSRRVSIEGADIVCRVPSRTKKKPRYVVRLEHVPVDGTTEKRSVIWSLKSDFGIHPKHSTWNIRYTWKDDREGSDIFTFYPHDIAAYIAVAGKFWKEQRNLTPMEMNPFALPSQREVDFYLRLCNNVVIFDPSLKGKQKTRKLHLAEKSILIARSIGVLGHDESMYWDPTRDGKLKDYDWKIPGKTE